MFVDVVVSGPDALKQPQFIHTQLIQQAQPHQQLVRHQLLHVNKKGTATMIHQQQPPDSSSTPPIRHQVQYQQVQQIQLTGAQQIQLTGGQQLQVGGQQLQLSPGGQHVRVSLATQQPQHLAVSQQQHLAASQQQQQQLVVSQQHLAVSQQHVAVSQQQQQQLAVSQHQQLAVSQQQMAVSQNHLLVKTPSLQPAGGVRNGASDIEEEQSTDDTKPKFILAPTPAQLGKAPRQKRHSSTGQWLLYYDKRCMVSMIPRSPIQEGHTHGRVSVGLEHTHW